MTEQIDLRVYNLKQLAQIYKVCRATMSKWIKPIRPKLIELGWSGGRLYTIRQVELIVTYIGSLKKKQ